jgi:uncharacterized protein YidB (DUF937 family)
MLAKKSLGGLAAVLIGVGAACSDGGDTTTTDAAATVTVDDTSEAATSAAADTTAADAAVTATEAADTETATESVAVADDGSSDARGPRGGPGGVSVESVAAVEDLVALVQAAYGDASLGLQRGHQPVESTLIEVLGISHDEMHVRMDAGQNLAAVATDLGIDPQTLIDALVESWSPAIDNLLADGTITAEQADAYAAALQEAFTYRVTWDGAAATPTFTGV